MKSRVLLIFWIAATSILSFCGRPDEPQAIFEENGRKGLVNYKGDVILENEFEGDLRIMRSGKALYNNGHTNYYINTKGRESKHGYAQATDFGSGYAFVVNPGEKISAIDKKYRVKEVLDYDMAEAFRGGIAIVVKDGLLGAINTSFKEIVPCEYKMMYASNEGDYIIAADGGTFTVFSGKGREVMKRNHVILFPSEGMIQYTEDGAWGYLNMKGEKVIRARREWEIAGPFQNGYSTYMENGRWGVLDKEGNKLIRAKYEYPIVFNSEGIAMTAKKFVSGTGRNNKEDHKFGFINIDDEEIIPFEYELAMPFHKNHAFVNDGKYWFVIDENNKQTRREEFRSLSLHPMFDDLNWFFFDDLGFRWWERGMDATRKVGSVHGNAGKASSYFPVRVRSDFFDSNEILEAFIKKLQPSALAMAGVRPDDQPEILANQQGFKGYPADRIAQVRAADRTLQMSKISKINDEASIALKTRYLYPSHKRASARNSNFVMPTTFNFITHYDFRINLSGRGHDKSEMLIAKVDSTLLSAGFVRAPDRDDAFLFGDIFRAQLTAGKGFVDLNISVGFEVFRPNLNLSVIPGDYPEFVIKRMRSVDLNAYNSEQQDLIRNEIFARHAYMFNTQKYKDHFGKQEWYNQLTSGGNRRMYSAEDISRYLLSPIEKHNIGILMQNRSTETVEDIDGNEYGIVGIGDQIWMAENLKTTKYSNGEVIPKVSRNSDWSVLRSGAHAEYGNERKNFENHGNLYNWFAVSDTRNICPSGWHVPTDFEWKQLEAQLGISPSEIESAGWRGTNQGSQIAGQAALWSGGELIDDSEFGKVELNILPSGYRDEFGNFKSLGYYGSFWSATAHDDEHAWQRWIGFDRSNMYRYYFDNKKNGYAVRCVKD